MKYYLLDNNNLEYFESFYADTEEWDTNESVIIGAFDEGEDDTLIPCGILKSDIFENNYWIKWLYVDSFYRLRGIATGLLNTLKDSIHDTFLKIQYKQDDLDIIAFLDKYGFDTSSSVSGYKVSFNILDLDSRIRDLPSKGNIKFLEELSKQQISSFNERFQNTPQKERNDCVIHYPISQYHKDSICYVKNDKISSYIIMEQPKTRKYDSIMIKYIYAQKDNQ